MWVWIGSDPDTHVAPAEFVGLLADERTGDMLAVIRPKGHGMLLRTLHPSKIHLTKPDGREEI